MISNASKIYAASLTKLQTLLGATYKPHTDFFEVENQPTAKLKNGFSVLLKGISEYSPQNNAIFIEREMVIKITHRTFAGATSSTKVQQKLDTVYDIEKKVIDAFRWWKEPTIGLVSFLPKTEGDLEQGFEEEDDWLVTTLTFKLQYLN